MFQFIPEAVRRRMHELEAVDARDRDDGTTRLQRLRQVPPETGRFIALLAAVSPPGRMIEVGTSAAYSTLWIALACRELGRTVTTFEVLPDKVALARETIRQAEVDDVVEVIAGDARDHLARLDDISFCFLDAEKEAYLDCYELVVPRMVRGGVLVADNAINHAEALATFLQRALTDPRVDALVVPVGKGELVARKL